MSMEPGNAAAEQPPLAAHQQRSSVGAHEVVQLLQADAINKRRHCTGCTHSVLNRQQHTLARRPTLTNGAVRQEKLARNSGELARPALWEWARDDSLDRRRERVAME
ncbi:hypothetical protein MRX96_054520 [Rhipicephalus microplus]